MNRRTFLKRSAIAVAASGVGCAAYAIGVEPHWLEIVHRDLPVRELPPLLEGAKLAQLSDLHIGPQVSDHYVVDVFNSVRALAPDIVVFTGDFITYRAERGYAQFSQLQEVLSHFPQGRLGTIGILGNHDYGLRWSEHRVGERVVAAAGRAGIHILHNQVATVGGLDIIGIGDLWAGQSDPARALMGRSSNAAIVLVHNPDTADKLLWPGYSGWMLAGHTHGGQCKPPFLPPPLVPVENKRYVAGAVSVDHARTLYISRGIGHLTQARFNVRPEVTLFTLRRA